MKTIAERIYDKMESKNVDAVWALEFCYRLVDWDLAEAIHLQSSESTRIVFADNSALFFAGSYGIQIMQPGD